MKKGFGAAKAQDEKQKASKGKYLPIIFIKDGEDAPMYLNGPRDEPLMLKVHGLKYNDKNGKLRFDDAPCAAEFFDDDGDPLPCGGCKRHNAGDKRVSAPKDQGFFSAVDMRWHGKKLGDKKGFDGEDKFFYDPLSSDVADPFSDTPPKRLKGYEEIVRVPAAKTLKFANKYILTCGAEAKKVGRKCKSCGKGTISIDGWKVGKKTVSEEPKDGNGEAIYSCSKCDEPEPWTIFDAPLVVTRTGADTSTNYGFSLDRDQEIPSWAKEYKPVDLEKEWLPWTEERYAKVLGGAPQGGGGKREKEVVEDEEEEDLYDKATKPKGKVSKLKKSKSSSDEEE